MYKLLFVVVFLNGFCNVKAQGPSFLKSPVGRLFFEKTDDNSYELKESFLTNDSNQVKENPRVVAIILNVTLGAFGMHRLYLGTDVAVPVFYTLTMGGGIVLWFTDLVALIATKDISKFRNNPSIFMWAVQKEKG